MAHQIQALLIVVGFVFIFLAAWLDGLPNYFERGYVVLGVILVVLGLLAIVAAVLWLLIGTLLGF